ncbi:MAG: hypothetical protein ACU833_13865 [Gammaproteobacteria bacterium]
MIKKQVPGALQTSPLSSGIESRRLSAGLNILFPVVAGVAIVAMHAGFHWPLKLPGHHGLEWFAVLMFVRCLSQHPHAAVFTAASAAGATLMPVWGFHDSGAAWSYLAAGAIVDGAFRVERIRRSFLLLALAAALAHAAKPLLHWLTTQGFGVRHGSLDYGLAYPFVSHLIFGFAGGTVGLLLGRSTRRVYSRKKGE